MKHASLASLAITIIVATMCSAWISHKSTVETEIQTLLASSSTIDQFAGIEKVKHESFDSLLKRLTPLLEGDVTVSMRASQLLVKSSFRDHCVEKLKHVLVDPELYESAVWWNEKKTHVFNNPYDCTLACDANINPWLRRLASLYCETLDTTCTQALITMPLRDRDSSVLLATLSIYKHATVENIAHWKESVDSDKRKIYCLLQGFLHKKIEYLDSDPQVQHLANIINEQNTQLAWRTMHTKDGRINPEIFLAGLIIDKDRFLKILIKSAQANAWHHPEHPVELARIFMPNITKFLPPEDRTKWWNLFACGLLTQQR
jgi:hypothetical protein